MAWPGRRRNRRIAQQRARRFHRQARRRRTPTAWSATTPTARPGKRPLSSMTPTIVLKDGKPFLVPGSPGGSRIITAVLQVILNAIDYHMPIDEAVSAPRCTINGSRTKYSSSRALRRRCLKPSPPAATASCRRQPSTRRIRSRSRPAGSPVQPTRVRAAHSRWEIENGGTPRDSALSENWSAQGIRTLDPDLGKVVLYP